VSRAGSAVGQWAVEAGFAAGWRVVRALPRPVAAAAFNRAADIATRRAGRGVTQLAANLRQVVGAQVAEAELGDLVHAGMRSYLRYFMEAFRLPSRSRAQILGDFHLDGEELLASTLAAGGAVAALPHAGNYDAAGAWVAAHGWPIATVAERLRPEGLYRRFMAFRESIGMEILPTTGGSRPPVEVLAERLTQGAFVPLLADRDLSRRGVEVTFFGGRTRMPAGPALLALRTGVPLFVVELWFEERGPCARLRGPLELPVGGPLDERVRRTTQMIADGLAEGIAAHPVDWHMLQRLWLPELQPPDGTQPGGTPPAGLPPAAQPPPGAGVAGVPPARPAG
jgi:phosphatidylinositol dimannoside acyltransferase